MGDLAKDFKLGFDKIKKRIEATFEESLKAPTQLAIAQFALDLIVKRTRLGYGVDENFGSKSKFPAHKNEAKPGYSYIRFRKSFVDLSDTTSPTKSNLTLTGQLLLSVQVTKARDGQIVIQPTGKRKEGKLTNLALAAILEDKGRVFNRISQLEYQQIIRFYRKTFGDLLKKQKLIR